MRMGQVPVDVSVAVKCNAREPCHSTFTLEFRQNRQGNVALRQHIENAMQNEKAWWRDIGLP
jgi:hypothetical protein